ncbi:MAG: hypothetical protein U1F43_07675 [Myxococcota bacterium]
MRWLARAAGPVPSAVVCALAGLAPASDEALALLAELRASGAARGTRVGLAWSGPPVAATPAEHAHLAAALMAHPSSDPGLVGHHLARAGEAAAALPWLLRAAQESARELAFERAAELYAEAAATGVPPALRASVHAGRAEALASIGRGAEAADACLEAARASQGDAARDLRRQAMEHLLAAGHLERGLDLLDELAASIGASVERADAAVVVGLGLRKAALALRGLGRRARRLGLDDGFALDLFASATLGLALIDGVRGTAFQARHVLLALDSGDAAKTVRALALEVMFVAARGTRERARTERLLASLDASLAERQVDDPVARGYAELARAFAAFFEGRFAAAASLIDRAEVGLAAVAGAARAVTVARLFRLWSMILQGRLLALAKEAPRLARHGADRGDLYVATEAEVAGRSLLAIAAGQAEQVPGMVARALARWPAGFHAPQLDALIAECQADLYRGRADAGLARLEAAWPRLEREHMLDVQVLRIEAHFLLGRAGALAGAAPAWWPRRTRARGRGGARRGLGAPAGAVPGGGGGAREATTRRRRGATWRRPRSRATRSASSCWRPARAWRSPGSATTPRRRAAAPGWIARASPTPRPWRA